jgi:hypothetical protein
MNDLTLNVYDICSPSKVRSDHCRSPRERYFVTMFPDNGSKDVGPKVYT